MSEILETVLVIHKESKHEFLINAMDFDESIHAYVSEATKPSFKVSKKDGKFLVVNGAGEQQGDAFETKAEAEAFVTVLVG